MNISTLTLIRPGITAQENFNLYQGYQHISTLTDESRTNAIELRSLCKQEPLDSIFCVDTAAAQQTAHSIFEEMHQLHILDDDLVEESYKHNTPCASTIREMGFNVLNVMSAQVNPGSRVALIAHQECLRSILFAVKKIHFGQATLVHFLDIKPCVPFRLANVEKIFRDAYVSE